MYTDLRIELLPWEQARAHAAPIRFAVFVEEQRVPAEIELDEMDAKSLHAVAFGDREVVLSAQVHAMAFYRAHGFVEEGAEYMDAGIPHVDMRRAL